MRNGSKNPKSKMVSTLPYTWYQTQPFRVMSAYVSTRVAWNSALLAPIEALAHSAMLALSSHCSISDPP